MPDIIRVDTVLHSDQRYETTGDWEFFHIGSTRARLRVKVSEMPDERYEQLVAVHEIIEALLCKQAGIAEKDVSDFDKLYEAERENDEDVLVELGTTLERAFGCTCEIAEDSEPGDDIHAPYYRQHQIATSVERMLAAELGVDWNAYEQANLDLYNA